MGTVQEPAGLLAGLVDGVHVRKVRIITAYVYAAGMGM